jgi:thioredoxin reductase (NADPH)
MPTKHTSEIAETPDISGAYPRLADAQLETLQAGGTRRAVDAGEALFSAGDRDCDFFVVLSGLVAVVEGRGLPDEQVISVHGRGRFLGDVGLLAGQAALYSAVAAEPGEVLALPVTRLRELMAADPGLGDLIVRACLIRRSMMISLGVGTRIIGSRYSPDARRLRDFAARNRIPARWLDLEADPAAEALLDRLGVRPEDTPLVILYGRQLLRNPANADLARALGLPASGPAGTACGLLVVGSGPAGLSAAVYGASEGLDTVVLDQIAAGGQAGTSSLIENYLGFPAGISGAELAERAALQARKFGARFVIPAEASAIAADAGRFEVQLVDQTALTAKLVVIATGAAYRRLDVPRREHFEKSSIYYAASPAEAALCHGDPVVIVGGGNSAGQAAVFLARHAGSVTLVVQEDDLSVHMSRYLISQIEGRPGVRVLCHSRVSELIGDQLLDGIVITDRHTGERSTVPARSMFVFIGTAPCTGWLGGLAALDDQGFVRTGPDAGPQAAGPDGDASRSLLETSQPGLFAAGDVRSGSARRVAAAVGDGAIAIRLAFERMQASPPR